MQYVLTFVTFTIIPMYAMCSDIYYFYSGALQMCIKLAYYCHLEGVKTEILKYTETLFGYENLESDCNPWPNTPGMLMHACLVTEGAAGPRPRRKLLPTTDYLLDMTGRNISDWIIKTTSEYTQTRYNTYICITSVSFAPDSHSTAQW